MQNIPNAAYTRTNGFGNEGADKTIPRFYIEDIPDELASQREGRPIYRSEERVELLIPGNMLNIKVDIVADYHRQRWPEAYAKFRQGQEIAIEGTPLEQWPILKRAQVLELKALNLLTVEHVRDMSDTVCQRFMGGMRLRTLAKAYLDDAEAGALLAEKTAEAERRAAENAEQKAQIEELKSLVNRLHDEVQTLRNAPSPIATTIPGMGDPLQQMQQQQPVLQQPARSALDSIPEVRKRPGRKPMPRDAQGNIIREPV